MRKLKKVNLAPNFYFIKPLLFLLLTTFLRHRTTLTDDTQFFILTPILLETVCSLYVNKPLLVLMWLYDWPCCFLFGKVSYYFIMWLIISHVSLCGSMPSLWLFGFPCGSMSSFLLYFLWFSYVVFNENCLEKYSNKIIFLRKGWKGPNAF